MTLLLGALGACTSPRGAAGDPAVSPQARTRGEAVGPPECSREFGGTFGYPASPTRIQAGTGADPTLAPLGAVVFVVTAARGGGPLPQAFAYAPHLLRGDSAQAWVRHGRAETDRQGGGTLRVPAGAHELTVRRIGYDPWLDTLVVRAGYTDTVYLGLGEPRMCYIGSTGPY